MLFVSQFVVPLLIILLYLVYAISVAYRTAPSETLLRLHAGCVIPIYAPKLLYEFKWMFETVTSSITTTCSCTLIMKDPGDFLADFTPWKENKTAGPPYPGALFVFERSAHDHALWNDQFFRYYFRNQAILFHTSDEFDDADVSYYPLFKRVDRNYYSSKADRQSSLRYLLHSWLLPTPSSADASFALLLGWQQIGEAEPRYQGTYRYANDY